MIEKKHTNAPSIRVGDWATGIWCAQAVGYKNPSCISRTVCKDIIKLFHKGKNDFVMNNRNESNTDKGRYTFYNIPLLKRWAKAKGRTFNEGVVQGDLFGTDNVQVSATQNGGVCDYLELEEIDSIIYSHKESFLLWIIKNEPKQTRSLFNKYVDHFSSIIMKSIQS